MPARLPESVEVRGGYDLRRRRSGVARGTDSSDRRRSPRRSDCAGPTSVGGQPPRGVLIVGGFVWSPHLPSESAGTLSVDLIARGDGVRADERIRTADTFITRTPRRLSLVAVPGADRPGQANFGHFAPELFCGWSRVLCCHPVATRALANDLITSGERATADEQIRTTDPFITGDVGKADARIRTADPFITRKPRRLWLVAVRRVDRPGQANFGRFVL
jgi:hypothetical protein